MFVLLCTLSDNALYLYQFRENIPKGLEVIIGALGD